MGCVTAITYSGANVLILAFDNAVQGS